MPEGHYPKQDCLQKAQKFRKRGTEITARSILVSTQTRRQRITCRDLRWDSVSQTSQNFCHLAYVYSWPWKNQEYWCWAYKSKLASRYICKKKNPQTMWINCNCPYQLKSCKKILDFLIDETAKLKLTFLSFSDFFFFRFCTFHAMQS